MTIEVYVHARGRFLRCITETVTDASKVRTTLRLIMITERFSEPSAIFVVLIDGEIYADTELP